MSDLTLVPATPGVQLPGMKYRVTGSIRAPYTVQNIEGLEKRWNTFARGGRFHIDRFAVSFPNADGVWKVTVDYTVGEAADPLNNPFTLDSIGTIFQNIISTLISPIALLLTQVQQFVVGTIGGVLDKAKDAAHEVLNPGVLILVVVGIALVAGVIRR